MERIQRYRGVDTNATYRVSENVSKSMKRFCDTAASIRDRYIEHQKLEYLNQLTFVIDNTYKKSTHPTFENVNNLAMRQFSSSTVIRSRCISIRKRVCFADVFDTVVNSYKISMD